MPVFNVLRINETQLAKLRVIRSEHNIKLEQHLASVRTVLPNQHLTLSEWKRYIRKQSKKGNLTSMSIQRIIE